MVATGDSHIYNVGVIPSRDDEPDGPAAATEFLATSSALARTRLADNPHFALVNQQRGYQTFDIEPGEWRADVKVLDRVQAPGGALSTLARFAVEPGEPGVRPR